MIIECYRCGKLEVSKEMKVKIYKYKGDWYIEWYRNITGIPPCWAKVASWDNAIFAVNNF